MGVDGVFPPSEEKACLSPHPRFGVKKADTGPRRTAPPAKKSKVAQKPTKPKRTASRPKNDDDDWGNGARGMDIVIGGGGIRIPNRGGYGGGGYGGGNRSSGGR